MDIKKVPLVNLNESVEDDKLYLLAESSIRSAIMKATETLDTEEVAEETPDESLEIGSLALSMSEFLAKYIRSRQ
jgi:hypothetical protein